MRCAKAAETLQRSFRSAAVSAAAPVLEVSPATGSLRALHIQDFAVDSTLNAQ